MPQLTECDIIGHCYNPDEITPRECGRCHEMESIGTPCDSPENGRTSASLLEIIEVVTKEVIAQAVCNGKGSEREAALKDDIKRLVNRIDILEFYLSAALPFVEDHMDSDAYNPGVVRKVAEMIRETLRIGGE